ncbi:MAG: sigma-70 family RNA polymerase sigma factor [Sphingobacteriales bacterium]|jgi:RNA polymerase sigma-70 factor (family 1)|nr:sigma-70 family RNA polymerase sigma factor [Sphingobacteriales bacterium]
MSSYSLYEDSYLLALMSQNNHKAFEEIWHRYWSASYNAAYKRLQDEDQSREVVQELFVDIWERREVLKVENLKAYLSNAVRYKIYKVLSKSNASNQYFDTFDSLFATASMPDNSLVEKELESLALQWIDTLPAKRKEIFLLFYHEQLSTKEIADRLGISQKTVQNQIGTATNELRRRILLALIMVSTVS